MTKTSVFAFPSWPTNIDRVSVGFDEMFHRLNDLASDVSNSNDNAGYPPYNIKKTGENKYCVEMAVAGFSNEDIDIMLEDGKLKISGKSSHEDNQTETFVYKGISNRAFTRTFSVADTVEVQTAELVNGMLKIHLENIIPEHKKPKKIEITTPTLLTHTQDSVTETEQVGDSPTEE